MSRPESAFEDHQPSSSPSPSLAEQLTSEEFQFLRCQDCQAEAKCPKLLPCLHSLCTGCLEPPDLQCPICKVPRPLDTDPPVLDNVFFESLQRHLSLHRQVMDERAACTRCKNPADFWCSQCEKLYCPKCYETHGYFLKHEAQRLEEIRTQPVLQFLDSMRKTNNIFCSHHSRHPNPMLTSIYCRGCSRALCCSCAILDSDAHKDLKCDIRLEIEQRQGELDSMTQVLQAREVAFGAAQAEMQTAVSQLDRERAAMEELVRSRISQVLARVRAQERELLEAVNQRYQRDYGELAGRLQRLDATLQRIRTGSVLVQKMRRYASDQEVLDMHGFLRQALHHLSREEPRSAGAAVCADGFEEVKARLQDLVSGITQGTDLPLSERASPQPASTPETSSDIGLGVEVEAPGPAQAQPEAVVQSMPGAHPVPVNAYSIRDCMCRENDTLEATPQKRKACQTESPRKMVKLQSPEREARLEPGPSTSQVASPPHWEEPRSPKRPHVEDEDSAPHINHLANSHEEAGDCIVINSSEDSDTENSTSRDMDESSSESSDAQLEGPNSLHAVEEALTDPQAEDRPLVFFDLRIDSETQKISQLSAVNRESKFRALIRPQASLSVYSKTVSLEVGLEHFLRFLRTMPRPVLACYKLWGPSLPCFFHALDGINRLWELQEVTSGFLAVLPLIRECVPGAGSFRLKSLAATYLARTMNEGSALASVLTMRDLCRLLEVSPGPRLAPHIYSFANLHCFSSLQPLVRAAVLAQAQARLLALRNVNLTELQRAYHRDPRGGLRRYSHYLSMPGVPEDFILQALSLYFESLAQSPASASMESRKTTGASPSHSSNVGGRNPQQS